MEIPVELRLEIYRHLLHAEYVYEAGPCLRIKLDTAILGVCHQVRSEASGVLYEENKWIRLRRNWCEGDYGRFLLECGLPIIHPGVAVHIRSFALQVSWSLYHEDADTGEDAYTEENRGTVMTTAIAYSEETLNELCRTIWLHALDNDIVDIMVELEEKCGTHRSVWQEKLLAPFRQVRGVRSAFIWIYDGSNVIKDWPLKQIMEDGKWTWEQIKERLVQDKQEGDARFKFGNFLKAEISYRRGIKFMVELSHHFTMDLPISDNFRGCSCFLALRCEIYNNHARVASRLGKFACAVDSAGMALSYCGIPHAERARAHYQRGISYVALHNDIEAGKDFTYALDLLPMDESIKQQLDGVEGRLGKKITEHLAPILVVSFPESGTPEWRGDPRIVQAWDLYGIAHLQHCRVRELCGSI